MPYCPRCKTHKLIEEFRKHKKRKSGVEAYCKECANAYQRAWRDSPEYKEKARQRQRNGFSQKDADTLLHKQGGVCPICGTDNPGKNGWHMDHCHVSGKVRGMLCSNCNRGLGHFKDSNDILYRAIKYLRRFK